MASPVYHSMRLGRPLDVDLHFRDRVAGIDDLGAQQLVGALADALGELVQIFFRASLMSKRSPGRLRLLGGGDRLVHVGRIAGRNVADLLFIGRVDGIDPVAGLAGDQLAAISMCGLRGLRVHVMI